MDQTMKMQLRGECHHTGMYVCVCVTFHTHHSYSVENSYMEEKEDTCNSLGEIAENVQ